MYYCDVVESDKKLFAITSVKGFGSGDPYLATIRPLGGCRGAFDVLLEYCNALKKRTGLLETHDMGKRT